MIDWMAWHKLNVLHWHLTDDQGWRLEIRKYPRLTSVGAWRIDPGRRALRRLLYSKRGARHRSFRGGPPCANRPGNRDAGPCDSGDRRVSGTGRGEQASGNPARHCVSASWGVHTHLFNMEPHTFVFLENVLAEVIELFPSPTIHIGGDEAVKDEWNASPEVQARARKRSAPHYARAAHTAGGSSAGTRFCSRVCGKTPSSCPGMGFPERTPQRWPATTPYWRRGPTLYFDNRQSALPTEPPGRLKVVSLEDVYRFEPHDAALSDAQRHHVLGIQANLWTEHIQTEERVAMDGAAACGGGRRGGVVGAATPPTGRISWSGSCPCSPAIGRSA